MQRNIFSPRLDVANPDGLSDRFGRSAQWIFILTMVFLPIVFIPGVAVALGLVKAMIVGVGVYFAFILTCFAWLRRGKVRLTLPLPAIVFWGFLGVTTASALLSGDVFDSLFGAALDVHSVGFLLLFALVMSLAVGFAGAKTMMIRLLLGFGVVLLLVYGFSLLRFVAGAETLSFGVFVSPFLTPVGGLNDLALYAGLALIILLTFLGRIPANVLTRVLTVLIAVLSLLILVLVNFYFVWMFVAVSSLLAFVYLLAKDTWLTQSPLIGMNPTSRFSLAVVGMMCVVAGSFVVNGDYLSAKVNEITKLNYVEIRPSMGAMFDITRSVYEENALLGIGPNRFEDAWRQYKNAAINDTSFWNTSFVSGSSYIATIAVTTGVAGLAFLLFFIGSLLYYLYRQLFLSAWEDVEWQQIGTTVFVATTYLWITLFFYTPGATILLLTACFTGLSLAIVVGQHKAIPLMIDVTKNRQQGFILISSTVLAIVFASGIMLSFNTQFSTQGKFVNGLRAFAQTGDVPAYDRMLAEVSGMVPAQDLFIAERARLRLADLNRLSQIVSPTENDQLQFNQALSEGVKFADEAIIRDPSNPFNHALLGSFYGLVNPAGYPEVLERRTAAFATAQRLDPLNPEYHVLQAQIASRFGDLAGARSELMNALALKRDYTEALLLLAQLDIQEGNATSAIAATETVISIEPANPGRYFQLGLLRLAIGELEPAVAAFEAAIMLDQNYANARYMLALTYLDLGRQDDALTQLRLVAQTNPDNQSLLSLIAQVEGGDLSRPAVETVTPLVDESTTAQSGEQTVTTESPDTPLVSPVNRVSMPEGAEAPANDTASEESN